MRRIRWVCFIILVSLFFTACNLQGSTSSVQPESGIIPNADPTRDFSDEYKPETDFQYNLEYDDTGTNYITESEDGFYFIDGLYLYYMDKPSLQPVPLCKRADCLHDKETDAYKKSSCEAFVGNDASSLFYYDNSIYILSTDTVKEGEDYKTKYILLKYAADGTLLGTIYTFQGIPCSVIRHRDYMYYSYQQMEESGDGETIGQCQIVEVSLKDQSERILYTDDLVNGMVDKLFACGKHLYAMRNGYDPKFYNLDSGEGYVTQAISFNLQTNQYEIIDPREDAVLSVPIVYQNTSLLYKFWYYDYQDQRNKSVFKSDLDGKNEEPFLTLSYNSSRIQWDGNYLYEDNWPLVLIAKQEPVRKVTVYNDEETRLLEFDFTNVEGKDFSEYAYNNLRISDDYIFTKTRGPGNEGNYILCVDKNQIQNGSVQPRVIFEKEEVYCDGEYITIT